MQAPPGDYVQRKRWGVWFTIDLMANNQSFYRNRLRIIVINNGWLYCTNDGCAVGPGEPEIKRLASLASDLWSRHCRNFCWHFWALHFPDEWRWTQMLDIHYVTWVCQHLGTLEVWKIPAAGFAAAKCRGVIFKVEHVFCGRGNWELDKRTASLILATS